MKVSFFILFLLFFAAPAVAQDNARADAMASLQGQLVRTAADIRRIEHKLSLLDQRLDDLKLEGERLKGDYLKQRDKMASTLAAMTRMRRVPKEAVLIRPGGPLQAARTSMLLTASLPAIESQAASVKTLLTDLENNQRELRSKTDEARAAKDALDQSHRALSALLEKRQAGGTVSAGELQAVHKLAREARDLRDLLTALEDGQDQTIAFIPQELMPDSAAVDGILPVSGIIRTRYGQKDEIGARAAGLTIESLGGSLVVAPLPGIVRFSGTFKGYGNIVIIAHQGGYHSLIAGLGTIHVRPGQAVVSGEPIGILGADTNQNQASTASGSVQERKTVYYELRLHGQPVNPARKLPDLG